jgi:hypothetical protein
MRLDMFKWVPIILLIASMGVFIMFLMSACTMYSIKLDPPEHAEFDFSDKRVEKDGGPIKKGK